jgi:hypothetical protein
MRLVNLYAGDEKNLAFAEDIAKLLSHIEKIEESNRWEAVEQISYGINEITVAGGGRPLSADGIRGIQQLICKVSPIQRGFDFRSLSIRLLWFRRVSINWE